LGQVCPKHHRLKHQSRWTPTPATKDEPPGWTSPTGRRYPAEQPDRTPPIIPPGLWPASSTDLPLDSPTGLRPVGSTNPPLDSPTALRPVGSTGLHPGNSTGDFPVRPAEPDGELSPLEQIITNYLAS
ncbi:HNH endonuclease, partial [Pseudarthrobacter enclensis]